MDAANIKDQDKGLGLKNRSQAQMSKKARYTSRTCLVKIPATDDYDKAGSPEPGQETKRSAEPDGGQNKILRQEETFRKV